MQEKTKRILFISFLVSISFVFLFNSKNVSAGNFKTFIVEKSGSDAILISDGYSQYIIGHSYNCYDSQFIVGSTIYIDTYYSPSYGDDIIISDYNNTICEITNSDSVNIKQYYVDNVFDSEDKIIVSNSSGKYLVEYGIGCSLSMWRYEGKMIDIDTGGAFLDGISDTIYLFDSGRNCRVWDAEELSGGSYNGYTSPSNLSKTCPANSSLVGTDCICNFGYVTDPTKTYCTAQSPSCPANSSYLNGQCVCNHNDIIGYVASGNNCITYTQNCQNKYGANTYGNENSCSCGASYEWNSNKTACVLSVYCSENSTKVNNQCICNNGYSNYNNGCLTYNEICKKSYGNNVIGFKKNDGQVRCDCVDGYEWDGPQTACIKKAISEPTNNIKTTDSSSSQVGDEENKNEINNNNPQASDKQKLQSLDRKKEINSVADNNPNKTGLLVSISDGVKNIFKSISSFFRKIFK
jgi:hypothetical protein